MVGWSWLQLVGSTPPQLTLPESYRALGCPGCSLRLAWRLYRHPRGAHSRRSRPQMTVASAAAHTMTSPECMLPPIGLVMDRPPNARDLSQWRSYSSLSFSLSLLLRSQWAKFQHAAHAMEPGSSAQSAAAPQHSSSQLPGSCGVASSSAWSSGHLCHCAAGQQWQGTYHLAVTQTIPEP